MNFHQCTADFFLKITFPIFAICSLQYAHSQIVLKQTIGNNITPKSIVHDNRGLFSAQNMMYKHTITLYSSQGTLLKTIPDAVNLNKFGFKEYKDALYKGAPVEACFTPDGKYLWVSNYAMYGPGFENEGCDGCIGDHYDPSFLYKINTLNYKIESVVKVGSVPKFLTISDNGKLLLVSNWTSSDVSIIDLDSEKEIKRVKVGPHPRGIVINKWNQKAYVAIMGSDKIAVINLLNFSVRYMQNVGKAPRHLILNKSNSHLFVAVNSANKVAKIDLKTWKIQFCDTKSGPRSMTLSASENYLYVVNYYANTFQKIDTKTMSVVETMSTLMKPIGIAGDWKNGNVWVSCYSGKIQIFNDPILRMESEALTEYKEGIEGRIKLAGLLLNMTEFPVKVEPKEPITKAEIETDLQTTAHKHTLQVSKIDDTNNKDEDSCQFTVIVGSFSFLENAYHLQSLLRTQSIPSFLLPSVNGGMTMVAVERTADHNRAVTILKALKHEHDLNAWIFKKNC